MSDKIVVVHPDGTITKITRRSSCGCGTILAVLAVVFGPAAWFPWPIAVAWYSLIVIAVVVVAVKQIQFNRSDKS